MTSDYTPTTEEVRAYWRGGARMRRGSEFDRWLSAVVQQAKAEQREEDARAVENWEPDVGWNRSTAEPDEWEHETWQHNQSLADAIRAAGETGADAS